MNGKNKKPYSKRCRHGEDEIGWMPHFIMYINFYWITPLDSKLKRASLNSYRRANVWIIQIE